MTELGVTGMLIGSVLAGVAISAVVACIPGFHIYNLMGFIVLGVLGLQARGILIAPEMIVAGSAAMVTTFGVLNSVPSILLSAPDESALFTVLPGQQFLMAGRGREALMLTAAGSLGAAVLLFPAAVWLLPQHAPRGYLILRPHVHWILWSVIVFMLMSEWPRGGTRGQGGWRKCWDGWQSTGAGLLTFGLAGFFGFILLYRSPVSPERAFQSLMPAFVGLFAVPGLLLNILANTRPPSQSVDDRLTLSPGMLCNGIICGSLGGGFAAFFPGVTGGVGGFLAGHAGARRDEQIFLISQGAAKLMYYAGAFLLFFLPGLHLTRSGAWLISGLVDPFSRNHLTLALGAILLSAALAFLLVDALSRALVRRLDRIDYGRLALGALLLMAVLVTAMTGWVGAGIAAVGTGIGLIPLLYGSRRMNCLAVLLLPLACNLSGCGPRLVTLLRLE